MASRARGGRLENTLEVVILLAVAGMAGAASFTHVHDWTMHNSPPGTGDWFGWANAMVSELIPLAAGLEARRRKRNTGHTGRYPLALILGAVALSLTGQFAEATPSLSGWIISAVPALGFLALVKLVLSRPATLHTASTPVNTSTPADAGPSITPAAVIPADPSPDTLIQVRRPNPPDTDRPAIPTDPQPATPPAAEPHPAPTDPVPAGSIPPRLLTIARAAALNHQQTSGRPITAGELAARISIPPTMAEQLLTLVHLTPVNGVAVGESR